MPRKKNLETSNEVFVLTLPLKCEPWQRDRLDRLFQVCNDIKNDLIAYELKQYKQLIQSKAWRQLQEHLKQAYCNSNQQMIKCLCLQRNEMLIKAKLTKNDFEKQINQYRKHYQNKKTKKYFVSVHVAQKLSYEVWAAFEKLLYGNGKEIHFSKWSEFRSISGKSNSTGIVYSNETVTVGHANDVLCNDNYDTFLLLHDAEVARISHLKETLPGSMGIKTAQI